MDLDFCNRHKRSASLATSGSGAQVDCLTFKKSFVFKHRKLLANFKYVLQPLAFQFFLTLPIIQI